MQLHKQRAQVQDLLDRCPGAVGRLAKYIQTKLQYKQPSIALSLAFSVMGFLKSGRAFANEYMHTTEPCLFVCLIADTGRGKSQGQKIVKDLLRLVGIQTASEKKGYFMGKPGSEAGIIAALKRQPHQYLNIDEFGVYLNALINSKDSFKAEIISFILNIFSRNGDEFIDNEIVTRTRQDVSAPYLSVFGASTATRFFDSITENSINDGLLPRFITFSEPAYLEDNDLKEDFTAREKLIDELKEIWDWKAPLGDLSTARVSTEKIKMAVRFPPPNNGDVFTSLDYWKEKLKNRMNECCDGEPSGAFATRALENTIKLCICLSEFDDNGDLVVTDKSVKYAIELITYTTKATVEMCEEKMFHSKKAKDQDSGRNKLLRYIPRGSLITLEALSKKAWRIGQSEEREQMLRDLKDAGKIKEEMATPFGAVKSSRCFTRIDL